MRAARAAPASTFQPGGQRLSAQPCVAGAAKGTCPDVDGGGESRAIGSRDSPREGKVGGEKLEASRWWVVFVWGAFSIDVCAVAASPPWDRPPAPPLSPPRSPPAPRPPLPANQNPQRFRGPRSFRDWLRPGEGPEFYLVLELNPAGTGLRLRRACECGFKGLAGTCVRLQLLARGQLFFSLLHIRLDSFIIAHKTRPFVRSFSHRVLDG